MKYLAFDLETAKITEDGIDLLQQRPLGIACCATLTSDGILKTWDGLLDKMVPQQCRRLIEYLLEMSEQGYTIVTFNGCGFDFDILAEESGARAICRKLAIDHIDMAFAMFAEKGFMVSLQSICEGMGLPGKSGSGADAPRLWAEGKREEVLAYVSRDVEVTLSVFQAIRKTKAVRWISKTSGHLCDWRPRSGKLLTVREAMRLPLPDVSWMKKDCVFCKKRVLRLANVCPDCGGEEFKGGPWPRSKFTGWLKKSIPVPNVEKWEY